MRALLPVTGCEAGFDTGGDVDVHAFYAADWTEQAGLRANFVSSVDGAVSVDGLSRGLQTPGDNRVFAALRDLADVVLVGAGTARAEGYRTVRPAGERLRLRREFGFADALPLAVCSSALRLDPAGPMFTGAAPEARTIVLTHEAADPERRRALSKVADVIDCGASAVEPLRAITALRDRGLTRILCEGGPHLLASLGYAGLLDELCLSITPLLAGPGPGRVSAGEPWTTGPRPFALAGLLEQDGALFCRYRSAPDTDQPAPEL